MTREFQALLDEETFLRRFDIVFGIFNVAQLLSAGIDHFLNDAPITSIVSLSVFFLINASLSVVSYWTGKPHQLEKLRIVLGIIMSPVIFAVQSPNFAPWWPAYYIMTIGGITFLCLSFHRSSYAQMLILYYAITAFIIELIAFQKNWLSITSNVGLFLIVSTIYFLILSLIQNSLSVVIELQQANDAISKLREENHRLRQSELSQQLENKDKELAVYSLNAIHKNRLMEDIKNEFYDLKINRLGDGRKIEGITKKLEDGFKIDKDWQEFKIYYEGIHKDFFKNLKINFPELTATDLKLCALIKLNLNSKEIARILGVLPESIKTGRYRIRKKLRLKQSDNLFDFLTNIEKSSTQETV